VVGEHTDEGKTVVSLGGEHTVSIGPVRALAERYHDLSVVQIDAHADLRDSYQNNRYSHACTMRRIRDITKKTVGIGIRNISSEGAELAQAENIPLFFARDISGHDGWQEDAISELTDNVYLTIDLDGFDPSVIPGVGTPEPGGLGWYETLRFLRRLCECRNVVGFDVVELMPIPGNTISEFATAKLVYKLIGYLELWN
jgi:agmatinase